MDQQDINLILQDKALFTPGPLTTSYSVKRAMLRDLGSRDDSFIRTVHEVRRRLIALAEAPEALYTAILMQGSGTFGIESVISSVIPPSGKLLVLVNGAYGERMLKIARVHHIPVIAQTCPENQAVEIDVLARTLEQDPEISHVAMVHCETTTGLINPIQAAGAVVKQFKRIFLVDAMSSFGAYPINLPACGIDFLVSSSNKCIEGVPGFSFVLANLAALQAARGHARSLSLDLVDQWESLEHNGQFRFTPPTHAILAFYQALLELEAEGGIQARASRYRKNYRMTVSGMSTLGFNAYLPEYLRGYIITSFYYPDIPNFSFRPFYERLSELGHVISPGKLSHADCFLIGHTGRLDTCDVTNLLRAVYITLQGMGVDLP